MSKQHNITNVQIGYQGRAFTSDQSIRGLWLMFDKKFEPLGIITGSCAYSVGTFHPWALEIKGSFHGEFRKRYGVARMVALARMRFQADRLGADGIIGIHAKVDDLHNNKWIEVTLSGTAIRYIGKNAYTPPSRQQEQEKVTVSSSLSPLQAASK